MDIIRFHNPTAPTLMEQGEIINGFTSKMWIERYAKEGEFKFVAAASSGIKALLPIGSFITHLDSTEIMIVENHEISDDRGKETEIIISGRGYETFFENRIVGSNKNFPTSGAIVEYTLAAGYTWNQIVTLINDHVLAANLIDDNTAIPYLSISTDVAGASVSQERIVKRGSLYTRMLELLEVDSLGVRVTRPGPWSAASPNVSLLIHKGVDRSAQVIFSYDTGEIESADYLWSNKKRKTMAYITGKWVETTVDTTGVGYDRRVMYVEASDIDNSYSAAPAGADLTDVVAKMQQRGLEALAAQNDVALTKAEVSKETNQTAYRVDFNVGDIITVHGDYNETSKMRISEYVEIEDENGRTGYPTLTAT